MGKTVKELFSAGKKLTDSELDTAFNLLDKMEVWPVSYVSTVGTVTDIHNTVLSFALNKQLAEKKKKLIVTVDHTLLTKRKQGQGEKAVVDSLMHTLNELKKYLPTLGIECIFIVLSQLNRDIESGDRVLIPSLHYPTKADIFGASSVFYSSDYVMITHKPIDISGMGSAYGPPIGGFPKGLPVKHPSTNQNMVYWHVIKGRFAEKSIIMMVDDFKNSRIFEYDAKQYSKLEE